MNFGFGEEQQTRINPFPQGQLNSEILDHFYPMIMKEVEKEFTIQDDKRTRRGTREYGYSFFKLEKCDFSYIPPPQFLSELGAYICQSLGHQPHEFTNIILSLYEEGFHLEPHIDAGYSYRYGNGFYFDDDVYGIIIEPDTSGQLYFIRHDENSLPAVNLAPSYVLEEKPGTIFCLQGTYRNAPYFHGVSTVSKRRISITFRKVVIEGQ